MMAEWQEETLRQIEHEATLRGFKRGFVIGLLIGGAIIVAVIA